MIWEQVREWFENFLKNFQTFIGELLEINTAHYELDTKLQEEKRKTLDEETLPFYLAKLDEIAKENDGHFALKRITWADVFFIGISRNMNLKKKQDLTANYPNLQNVYDNTTSVEGIKKWIEKCPKTDD